MTRRLIVTLAAGALIGATLAFATAGTATTGHAADMPVASVKMSTFRPSQLPPTCTSTTQTVYADLDTWVNEGAKNTAYGADTILRVTARGGNNARTLVRFALPVAPTGCTLGSATLRLHNAPTAGSTGRTMAVYSAATAWSNTTTWNTVPLSTGTAVNATAVAGWMTWPVKAHVDGMYATGNNGFLVQDALEGGGTVYTQQFDSRENATNKPELILLWQ